MLKSLFRTVSKKILKENQNDARNDFRRNQKGRDSRAIRPIWTDGGEGSGKRTYPDRSDDSLKGDKQKRKYFEHWKLGT